MNLKIPVFALFLVFLTLILIPVNNFKQIDCYMTKLPGEDLFKLAPITDGFDFPVGIPDATGYYVARGFGEDKHLGEDWNGLGGGNSDLGETVHAIGDGIVIFSKNCGAGWGNIIRIIHRTKDHHYVESLYAHLDSRIIETGTLVNRGEPIGTIGNVNGGYYAHLHLEVRTTTSLRIGKGYSADTTGFTSPTNFILTNRPVRKQ